MIYGYLPEWRWVSVSLDSALILLWLRLTKVGKLLLDWCRSSTTRTALLLNCSSKLSIGVSTLFVWFPAISPATYRRWLSHFMKRHTHCIKPHTTPAANMARHVCTAKSEHAHWSRPQLLAVFDPCRAERVVIGRQGGEIYTHTHTGVSCWYLCAYNLRLFLFPSRIPACSYVLFCDAMSLFQEFMMFRRIVLPSSSKFSSPRRIRNVSNYSPTTKHHIPRYVHLQQRRWQNL